MRHRPRRPREQADWNPDGPENSEHNDEIPVGVVGVEPGEHCTDDASHHDISDDDVECNHAVISGSGWRIAAIRAVSSLTSSGFSSRWAMALILPWPNCSPS